MGMLRLKDDAQLAELLKRSNVRIHSATSGTTKLAAAPQRIRGKANAARSEIEELMAYQISVSKLPQPTRQHNYLEDRGYKADFMWRSHMVALEVDGAVHRTKGSFSVSFERGYLLLIAGWTVLHVGSHQVRSGEALEWITRVLGNAKR